MESLRQIEAALSMQWTANSLFHLVETLVIVLSTPAVPKKIVSKIWKIAQVLAKSNAQGTKVNLPNAFLAATANFSLQLKFYKRLLLPNVLGVLARLAQNCFKETGKIEKISRFRVEFVNEEVPQGFLPGAVCISRTMPSADLLDYFLSHYLIEKVAKEDKDLLPLFQPIISAMSTEMFQDKLLGNLKRLSIRSATTLPILKSVIDLIECDLSQVVSELAFPTLIEYLYKEEDSSNSLELLKSLIKKCKSLENFIHNLINIRNINESQAVLILKLISTIPQSPFDQEIINFSIGLNQRLKSESNKTLVITSISHLISEKCIPTDFLLANFAIPAFSNLIYKYSLKANLNYNQNTPLSIISVLSLKFPDQIPGKIVQFCNETGSSLFSLQNLSEDEALALTRTVVNALQLYPKNANLIKRFARSVVSKYSKVRTFCFEKWPQVPIDAVLGFIHEFIADEINLNSFSHVFTRLSYTVMQKAEKPEDFNAFIRLFTCSEVISKRKIRFLLKKFAKNFENFSEEVFVDSAESVGFVLSLSNFETSLEKLLKDIEFDNIYSHKRTLEYVQQVFDDPNFEEIGKFNSMCKDLMKSANLAFEIVDQGQVTKAIDILWTRAINRAVFLLRSFTFSLKFRSLLNTSSPFFDALSFKVLPQVLKLTLIPDLQGASWAFFSDLVSFSPNFSQITWYLTQSLYKSSRNQWSDKALSKLFKFVENKINIISLSNSESFILERVVLWVLKQSGTSLRSTALTILIDFLHTLKFSSIDETILEICLLIESYSSPLLNSLFQPLLEILEPHNWEPFLNILLKLQPNTKQIILDNLLQYSKSLPHENWLITPVYLCLYDDTDLVSSSASEVWEKNDLHLNLNIILDHILQHLFSENLELSMITANALKAAIVKSPEWSAEILKRGQIEFNRKKNRLGFLKLLEIVCEIVQKNLVLGIEEFLIDEGMLHDDISSEILKVAITYLNTHGEGLLNEFFSLMQQRTTHLNEKIRNSAVVLIGYLAKFFGAEDFRIESTIELLLKSLDLPSDLLFSTVSKFLPRLVSFRQQLVEPLLQQEFKKLLENKKITERRGAGYGIGCLIKGGGLKSLVTFNILDKLESIINNKKAADHERGGVLIAIEGLGAVLGRSFEPYLGEVLPFIIDCFANKELSDQAAISTKVMISKLSAHGMKRILPQLTHGLEETKWRSKVGAIEALGKMAFCAPKQLSAALPNIVPQVIKAFSDTNPKVLEAANKAISDIGSVITNPEIFQLVPFLSKALGDISHLSEAFKVLIDTTFHHYLDTPSLSLIIPLVETGLRSRVSEYKKQACQIVGGITSLIRSPQEFSPYIERITSAMKFSLFDSLPEVRNIAAQNLASFCQGLGEELSGSILSWLLDTMEKSPLNFERSGAVHAYSEYLLYDDRWETKLTQLLNMVNDPSPIVKESYLGLFIFIPLNTQGKFEKYLKQVFTSFLDRLSDDSEEVRKIVIRVVQLIIQTYCKSSLNIILPPLEQGLFDRNWRKRSSCITLIGEMIEKIESFSRKEGQLLISAEHKNRILASVYILRADHTSNINTSAAQIWKAHVDNTPKFLVSLTPELVLRLIEISDNNDAEPREIASFAIQNLIQKYQNKIFSSYLKHFLTHFQRYPKGVAFVLRTVCEAASRNLLITYSEPIIQILEVLLKSNDLDYLHNAGGIFHDLYQKTTIEKPDPAVILLLEKMVAYPNACKELLSFRNVGITKALLPKIMLSPQRAETLPVISKIIADDVFTVKGLEHLFSTILKEFEEGSDLLLPVQIIVSNISDPSFLIQALGQMREALSRDKQLQIINYFCKNTSILFASFVDRLLEMTLSNLSTEEPLLLSILPETVKLILSPLEKEQLSDYFHIFKAELNANRSIPLFNVPKGLDPFLPFIQHSLMYGNVEIKELAARSYCEVIEMTNVQVLNAYAVMIVGPLIRVLSEKVPGDVKVSVLNALFLLLQKTPLKLKPFVSQLQSTFTKAVTHTEANVREAGARNVIELLKMNPRIDLLFGDLGTLNGPEEIVVKSLDTLQKIIKAIEVPSQLLNSTCNKIITELSPSVSKNVAVESGKLIYSIHMDLGTVIQCLSPISPAIIMLASVLARSSPKTFAVALPFIDMAMRENYEEALVFFEILAEKHPDETFDLAQKYFYDIQHKVLPALSMIRALPEERFNKETDTLKEILPAIAKECLEDHEEKEIEELKKTVAKIFNMKEKGIKNVLKALHLLEPDLQVKFRNFAQKLSN